MATKKVNPSKLRALIGNEAADKIGTYQESTGGGTPIPKGEKLKDHPEAKRVQQPRDEDGKFTYNAVNNKTLKHHPSRGTTMLPFLKHVNFDYLTKHGKETAINDENRYVVVYNGTKEELNEFFKNYTGNRGEWDEDATKKKGRASKEEKEAVEEKHEGLISNRKRRPKEGTVRKKQKPETPVNTNGGDKPKPKPETPVNKTPEKANTVTKTKIQVAEENKELISELSKIFGITPLEATKIVAAGKVKSVDDFKKILGE